MTGKDIITMSREELKRVQIIGQALEKKISQQKAAEILRLSDRQIRRIVKRIKEEGQEAIAHRARGKPSNRKLSDKLKQRVLKVYENKYYDFGPTLANEKLFERHKIKIGTQTLRNWLIEAGKWRIKVKRRKYRRWRQRRSSVGELIQMDGSHHEWFEDRGPQCVLMGYIDDASNQIYARFYKYEGTMPAMDSFKRYAKKYGIPHSIYLDKHTTYKSTGKQSVEEEMNGIEPMSEFERAMKELGVEVIHANSPQAKGRIERAFKTFQDRVVKEMRLRGIKDIEQANEFLEEYLPEHNRRFSKEPISKANIHRPTGRMNLDGILCFKKEHVVRNDYTVIHGRQLYQILERTPAKRVVVENRLNGNQHITHNGKRLKYRVIKHRPVPAKPKAAKKIRNICKPSHNHAWNQSIRSHVANKKAGTPEAIKELNKLIYAKV